MGEIDQAGVFFFFKYNHRFKSLQLHKLTLSKQPVPMATSVLFFLKKKKKTMEE